MKKKLTLLTLAVLSAVSLQAANPGFHVRNYSLTGMVEYSYNRTWSHHANFDIQAFMPINQHFEMEAKTQFSTANVHTGALYLRPKFDLPVGQLFIETDIIYRAIARNRLADIDAAIGLGYRMDYVSVTLGLYSRVLDNWDRQWHDNETFVVEPFNLLYRIEVFCRPQTNNWNLSFCFSNVDDYQMERMWQPLFMAGAWYDVAEHWRLLFWAQCKPTGMFHLDATFYGATFRTGFSYTF